MNEANEIFAEALELGVAARSEFLDTRCGDDEALRARIEVMMRDAAQADAFFEEMPGFCPEPLADPVIPETGRYRPEGQIGRGGMALVLKVRDQDLSRHLAMKVLKPKRYPIQTPDKSHGGKSTMSSPQARFLEEAQITAQLEHPSIIPVHELGQHEDGSVYFTMQLVRGRELDEIIKLARSGDSDWNLPRAVGVVVKACQAVAYAHSKGVVHRDLKPQNIMVGRFGEVYVIDWGLAKVQGRKDLHDVRIQSSSETSIFSRRRSESSGGGQDALMTMDGTVVGTPAVMAPEQAEGRVEAIDQRSDVYALGAILYTLLAGQAPYMKPGARTSSRRVLEMVIQGPPQPVLEIDPTAPPELVAIGEKAMARDQEKRYPSSLELAEDLQAWIDGRVVQAYESGSAAELRKWMRRNRPLTIALATAAMLLVVGTAVSLWQALSAKRHAQEAQVARDRSEILLVDMYTAYGLQAGDRGDERQAALWFAKAASLAEKDSHRERSNIKRVANFTRRLAKPIASIERIPGQRPTITVHPGEDHCLLYQKEPPYGAEVYDIVAQSALDLGALFEENDRLLAASWNADGSVIALGTGSGAVRLFQFPTMNPLAQMALGEPVRRFSFSRDGKWLAAAGDTRLQVWSMKALDQNGQAIPLPAACVGLRFDPTNQWVVCGTAAHEALLFQVGILDENPYLRCPHNTTGGWDYPMPQFDPKGEIMVTRHDSYVIAWWDVKTGQQLRQEAVGHWIVGLKEHPTEDHFLVQAGPVRNYHFHQGNEIKRTPPPPLHCFVWAVSQDNRFAMVCGTTSNSFVYDMDSGSLTEWRGPVADNGFECLAFSPSGRLAVTSSNGVQVWRLPPASDPHRRPITGGASVVALDGRHHLEQSADNTLLRRLDVASGKPDGPWIHLPQDRAAYGKHLSRDGQRIVVLSKARESDDYFLDVYDSSSGNLLSSTALPKQPHHVDVHPQGDLVGVVFFGEEVLLVDAKNGGVTRRWPSEIIRVPHVRFSPDGQTLFHYGVGKAAAWNTTTGQHVNAYSDSSFPSNILGISYSADEQFMACSAGRDLIVFDLKSQKILQRLAFPSWVYSSDFSRDGRYLVGHSKDHFVRVWDWRAGTVVGMPFVLKNIGTLEFGHDGQTVVTLQSDGNLDVWDWQLGRRLVPTRSFDIGGPIPNRSDEGAELLLYQGQGIAGGNHSRHHWFQVQEATISGLSGDQLIRWTELLSAQRITDGGRAYNLTNAEWLEGWQDFRNTNEMLR